MALTVTRIAAALLCVCVSNCGSPTSPSDAVQQSLLSIDSPPTEPLTNGISHRFTTENAAFRIETLDPARGALTVLIRRLDTQAIWRVYLGAPAGQSLQVGVYENAERFTSIPVSRPRFTLNGAGRDCGGSEGRFVIQQLVYQGTSTTSTGQPTPAVRRLHVSFAQRCTATSAPGLTGELWFVEP
jgi:hypothetical protein